ncbi:hypothetical protein Ancab_031471 [Ancistrocladus abbreviatus]
MAKETQKNIEDHQAELAVAEPEAEVASAVGFKAKTETVAEVVAKPREQRNCCKGSRGEVELVDRTMLKRPIMSCFFVVLTGAGISGKTKALLGTEFEDAFLRTESEDSLLEVAMFSPAPMGVFGCGFECLHNKQFSQINMNQQKRNFILFPKPML